MRLRAAQITAVAALLLTLVQVGKMVTGEGNALHSACAAIRLLWRSHAREPKTVTGFEYQTAHKLVQPDQ